MPKQSKVLIFAGTRKGGFIFTSDAQRRKWEKSDLLFKGWNVMHMRLDPRDQRLHAAVVHDAYGPTTHYSDDFGKSWTQAAQVPASHVRHTLAVPSARCRRPANRNTNCCLLVTWIFSQKTYLTIFKVKLKKSRECLQVF